jgi:serine/threonine protein kinase
MEAFEAQIYEGQVFTGALGTYTVQRRLGDGGFAGVFSAVDDASGGEVAVKVLAFHDRAPNAELEFDAERALLQMLSGATNVVAFIDHGEFEFRVQMLTPTGSHVAFPARSPFMVLERATGSLDNELANRHRISWERRLLIFRDVTKGVHQMHLRRTVHRDVKAENALMFRNNPCAKVTDLGRSKDTREPARFPAEDYLAGKGDLRFAPPEYLWGLGTHDALDQWRADLYHLGSLLYEIGTATGITSAALGDPRAIMRRAAGLGSVQNRLVDFDFRIPALREQFDPVIEAFGIDVPPTIRVEATRLLRQLVDPDPTARIPIKPLGRLRIEWDLQWLLRRVDIMMKRLAAEERVRSRRRRRHRLREVGVTKQ